MNIVSPIFIGIDFSSILKNHFHHSSRTRRQIPVTLNPAKRKVKITVTRVQGAMQLVVYYRLVKVVNTTLLTGNNEIDVDNLARCIYRYTLTDNQSILAKASWYCTINFG